jgi:crotonobetainyl-CoA:carnitine CoA-transferase CaiB-like acyl-CoA transferase
MLGHQFLGVQIGSDEPSRRRGNRHPWYAPQGVFPCEGDDRWVALTVQTDAQWAALAEAIGSPDLARRYPTAHERRSHQDEVERRIGAWTAERAPEEVERRLADLGIPVGEVLEVEALLQNAHLAARDFFDQHPIEGGAPRAILGGVWTFDDRRLGLRFRAPKLGEHNEQILREVAGLRDEEIAQLAADGVTGTLPRELESA